MFTEGPYFAAWPITTVVLLPFQPRAAICFAIAVAARPARYGWSKLNSGHPATGTFTEMQGMCACLKIWLTLVVAFATDGYSTITSGWAATIRRAFASMSAAVPLLS